MGGSSVDDDWELASPYNEVRTVVLVGKTGNGKSATGNSILGRKAFKSKKCAYGVTSTCELKSTLLSDGQMINVIDTPGLFDQLAGPEFIGKEIVKCINLAKDGIHAILLVFSVRARMSKEEEDAILSLQTLFGSKILDYMILVFTGGDEFDDDDDGTFEDFLGEESTELFQKTRELCNNRIVLFDNKTKDKNKKDQQVQQLISLVNMVVEQNDGQPYTDEIFTELKKGSIELHGRLEEVDTLEGYTKREISELKDHMQHTYEEQLLRLTEMVESKLRATTAKLEQQLAVEQAARIQAEENAHVAQMRSEEEIRKLREHLEKAQELISKNGEGRCNIL